jgi:hypothetical protein
VRYGHVGLAAEHGGQRLLRLHLDQVQPHLRRRIRQRRPGGGHQARGRRRKRGQRDPARDLVAQRGQVGLGRVQPGEQGVGVSHQDVRGRGELDPPPGPFGQSHPDLAFQRGELLGYGGGRVAERAGGRGHRPVRADGVQDPEPAHIKHEAELISQKSFCNWTLSDDLARLEP